MKPVMRYRGAKYRLAGWIQSFFPDHETYVEPFGGAAGVLMQKKRSYAEVYNDLDSEIVNVFRVLRDPEQCKALARALELTPYSRDEFTLSYQESSEAVEQARRTIVRAQMGFGSAGATKGSTGFRIDTARKYGTSSDLWLEYPKSLAAFCERLRGVVIENKCALEVIENHDRPSTLFFVDPPYVHTTRVIRGSRNGPGQYRHELSDSDHEKLLEKLNQVEGMVILSGYESALYNDNLIGWEKRATRSRISAGRGTGVRKEVVWLNKACSRQQVQLELIS